MNIIRVFPRRTTATPTSGFLPDVSVTFTKDLVDSVRLADAWQAVCQTLRVVDSMALEFAGRPI